MTKWYAYYFEPSDGGQSFVLEIWAYSFEVAHRVAENMVGYNPEFGPYKLQFVTFVPPNES